MKFFNPLLKLLTVWVLAQGAAWANPAAEGLEAPTQATAETANEAHPAVRMARSMLGIPYVRGGIDPLRGFDCSGLVYYIFNQLEVRVPRMSRDLFHRFEKIAKTELQPGDLLFFHTYARLSHVGIYIGQGRFIHAPRTGEKVSIESMDSSYYRKRYAGARRVMGIPPLAAALEPQAPGPSLAGL